jgi:hypothetical protein
LLLFPSQTGSVPILEDLPQRGNHEAVSRRHIWRIYLFGDAEAKESLGPLWLPEPLKVLASVKKF